MRTSMAVPVMDIGEVRMRMHERVVFVRMAMRFLAIPAEIVPVLVMLVVTMAMLVLERFVFMRVFVVFAQVQPDSDRHQAAGNPERRVGSFGEQQQR